MKRDCVHVISRSTGSQHSDVERPVARILPAVVNKDYDSSTYKSQFFSPSSESVLSLSVRSCSGTTPLTCLNQVADEPPLRYNTTQIKATPPLAQSTRNNLHFDGIPDVVEVLQRGPALLPKPTLAHAQQQWSATQHQSTLGDFGANGFSLSPTAGVKSVSRPHSTHGITLIGLPQRSNNDKPQSENPHRVQGAHRRSVYEPADASDRKAVERSCSEKEQRRGSDSPEAEVGENSVTTSENLPTSVAVCGGELKVRGAEMSRRRAVPLTDEQIQRIELFYSSHATQVFVCQCLASLHSNSPLSSSTWRLSLGDTAGERSSWKLVDVGVPVLIVDTGEGRRRRRLHVVLADPLSGFTLWRESVDHLTDYRCAGKGVHTLRQSTDHARLTALRFHDNAEADRLMRLMESLTSDPGDTLLNIASSPPSSSLPASAPAAAGRLGNGKRRKRRAAVTTKASISSPCWFSHVTQLGKTEAASIMHSGAM